MPARSFSYELQRRLVKATVQNPFLESVRTLAELTGVSVSKRSLEEILPDAAQDFDAFYQQRSVATTVGAILVAAVDAKGIPMVKPGGAQPKAQAFSPLPTLHPVKIPLPTSGKQAGMGEFAQG